MGGYLDRLKDALGEFVVIEDEDEARPSPSPAAAPSAAPGAPAAPHAAPAPAPRPAPGHADPHLVADLRAAVEQSASPAYGQFKALLAAMASVPDEAMRYTLALNAAQASHGVQAPQVLTAIDDRLRLLDEQRKVFAAEVAAEHERSVAGTAREMDAVDAEIAAKREEIRALEAKRQEMEAGLHAARAAIESSQVDFGAAYESVRNELEEEKHRISSHITSGT